MPLADELPDFALTAVDHDPFVADAPSGGKLADAGPIPKIESLPDFWQRWNGALSNLKRGEQGTAETVPADNIANFTGKSAKPASTGVILTPVDYDPFAAGDPLPQQRGVVDQLLGLTGERYQLWPERLVRSAITLPGDVASGRLPVAGPGLRREDFTDIPGSEQPNDEMIARAQDTTGLMVTGSIPLVRRGILGIAGGRPDASPPRSASLKTAEGNRQSLDSATQGAQLDQRTVPSDREIGRNALPVSSNMPRKIDPAQAPELAAGEVPRVVEAMQNYGYRLVGEKESPLSEARYLTFETENPLRMSKSGQAQLFKEMKDAGVPLANNPTHGAFQIRIASHVAGSGGHPSSHYEWRLEKSSDENSVRLKTIMEAMARIAKERPAGGMPVSLDQTKRYKLVPIDHDPFIGTP